VRRLTVFLAAMIFTACETFAVPSTTTSDVLPPPDLPGSNLSRSSQSSAGESAAAGSPPTTQRDYTGSLPDGTGYVASLVGGEDERITSINAGFVLEHANQAIPIAMVTFREGGGLGSAFSNGTYRSSTGDWTVEVRFDDAALEFLGESAAEVAMGSISTVSWLGMPVLLLNGPFRWDHEQLPVEVVYETFLVRRSCGDLALVCSSNEILQMIEASTIYEGHLPFSASTASMASVAGRTLRVTLGESATPR
jgi:hypothetical protein